ncbi:MAG: hypothetical protein F4X56_02940 [Gammaproteobacteria bacterium]|nr:hypothetical protein [Gammaproteobacteria bacterium]
MLRIVGRSRESARLKRRNNPTFTRRAIASDKQAKSTDLVKVRLNAQVSIGTPNKINNATDRPDDGIFSSTLDPTIICSGCRNSLSLARGH